MSQHRTTTAVRSKGRPPRGEEQAITDRLVDAALTLFLRDGYESTSMKRVIEVTGVSPGTLYSRFGNKEALFRAAITRQVQRWRGDRIPRPLPGNTLAAELEQCAFGLMRKLAEPDVVAFARLIGRESERFPEVALLYRDNAMKLGVAELVENVLATTDGSGLGLRRARSLAISLYEWVIGWQYSRIVLQEKQSDANFRRAARRIADTLVRAEIGPSASQEGRDAASQPKVSLRDNAASGPDRSVPKVGAVRARRKSVARST